MQFLFQIFAYPMLLFAPILVLLRDYPIIVIVFIAIMIIIWKYYNLLFQRNKEIFLWLSLWITIIYVIFRLSNIYIVQPLDIVVLILFSIGVFVLLEEYFNYIKINNYLIHTWFFSYSSIKSLCKLLLLFVLCLLTKVFISPIQIDNSCYQYELSDNNMWAVTSSSELTANLKIFRWYWLILHKVYEKDYDWFMEDNIMENLKIDTTWVQYQWKTIYNFKQC